MLSVSLFIRILIYIVIFIIMHVIINNGVSYWKSVIIYAVISAISILIYFWIFSFSLFFIAFASFFVTGLLVIWILEKIADLDLRWFITIGVIIQYIASMILSALLSLG